MIIEALGLTTSGMAGAVFSLISDWRQHAREQKSKETELQLAQEARLQGQVYDFLSSPTGFTTTPAFSESFKTLVRTYCICIILCVLFPDRVIYTFDANPVEQAISFFGIFEWKYGGKQVYEITTGGVAYGLLNLLAFQIGTVITGLSPTEQQRR